MKIFFLLLWGLIGWSLMATAQADTWYRWVDQSGKVHYSDSLPPDTTSAKSAKIRKHKGIHTPHAESADMPYETRRAHQNFPVTLYVIDDCGDICQQARALLNQRGIPYAENSLKSQEQLDAFKKMSGAAGVPVLTVGKVWLKSFQAQEWHNELDNAGYPKTAPYGMRAPTKRDKPAEESPKNSANLSDTPTTTPPNSNIPSKPAAEQANP